MRLISGWLDKAHTRGIAYTSLDAMKLFAIVTMTVDHVGAYFFPETWWFRAIGRLTFPVWFFLAGYSRLRSLSAELWMYAALMVLIQPFVGANIFPINTLCTVILCRWLLNACDDFKLLPHRLPELMACCVLLSLFSMELFEYGTVAFMLALIGKMVRERETRYFRPLLVCSYLNYIGCMMLYYPFDLLQKCCVILGTAIVMEWLSRCPNGVIWPDWTRSKWKTFIAVLSRNTIPYYFYHRIIFQVIATLLLGKGLVFSLRFFRPDILGEPTHSS